LFCWAARCLDGHCHRACGTGHHGDQAGCSVHTAIAGYGHDHRMGWCVTNCVTITTYNNGLPWTLRDAWTGQTVEMRWSTRRVHCFGDEEAVGSNPVIQPLVRRHTDVPVGAPQWLHLWLHSPVVSKARGWSCPGRRPAHTVGVVTADQWVDDLESERPARDRGFESLRFRPSTSINTDMVITRGSAWTAVVAFLVAFEPPGDSPG
jgi:hypothetical protein